MSSEIMLDSGEQLVLWTDGVTETQNDEGIFFGPERALEVVASSRLDSAESAVMSLYARIEEFANHSPQADDITAVICKAH